MSHGIVVEWQSDMTDDLFFTERSFQRICTIGALVNGSESDLG